uniref:Mesothelin n=1 Tax=Pogona vitticeps TaxID=103695 RepID=A0ABM5EZY2_9SAUR
MLHPLKTLTYLLIAGWAVVMVPSSKADSPTILKHVLPPSCPPGKLLPSVAESLQPSRRKRASEDCPPDKTITVETLKDQLMPIYYTPDELGACLKGQFLLDNLPLVTAQAYTDLQMFKLKQNLDREFPEGYTDEVLANLGVLLEVMSEDDIKKWNIASPNTLGALLSTEPTDDVASLIIQQYVHRGNPLNAAALNAIGPSYICILNPDQLNMINEEAIKMATPLELSRCSQATVDKLYPKAKRAFSDRHNAFPEFYNLIKPYLRGAPAEDLKALSKSPVNMDIETFLGLKNDILMKLTPSEVKGLLGRNAEALKEHQSEFPIRDWIHKQKQEELEILGIQGGIPDGYITLARAPNRKKRRVVLASKQV